MTHKVRVPAEWEDYDSVMIAWPHGETDWADMLEEVTACYVGIANAIVKSGLRLVVASPQSEPVREALSGIPPEKLIVFETPTNDTWTRDYGPITLETDDGAHHILDFQFNGWGLKFAANLDNMVNLRMVEASLLSRRYMPQLGFVFEGGSMESDGRGTMLTTSACLLSLNRNGVVTKDHLREYFKRVMGFTCVHFLDYGHLEGDDTDSHIDTLARFAPGDTILYVKSYNPADSHTAGLEKMEAEIMELRTPEGNPYNLLALPLPDPIYDENGERLPATYANFLITPRTVLLPVYGQPDNDRLASQMLRVAFPDREIIEVDCRALIRQHGSLHCATMQLSKQLMNI
ncbi:MAG: agmatine deiminase family protein [Muribaculaceae bacterium]|nr:agmatine deiminase family protein [Muribaculaceae bacterium]